MKCNNHKVRFSYTCPFCEEEYSYISRTNLIDYFRAGVLGKEIPMNDVQQKAAYEQGKEMAKNYKKK
jgi:hypothetical protein